MKKWMYFLFAIGIVMGMEVKAQVLRPYILGATTDDPIEMVIATLKTNLESEGIEVLGDYMPADDNSRRVIVFTDGDLVQAVKRFRGQTGFAAALRIGLTWDGDQTYISYTNPAYWGNSYYGENYSEVEQHYKNLTDKLTSVMSRIGTYNGKDFGSETGIDVEDLWDYRYMLGMPRFDDVVELRQFSSYEQAVSKIEANLKRGVEDITLVYSIEIPGEDLKLYGFGLSGEDGESKFLPKIDIANTKHTAFLPYEMLVKGGQVIMLHGRYRIALSFPDLKMSTFTKIMSTPGDIRDMLERVSE